MKDDRVYLRHILRCLEAILEYTDGQPDILDTDRKTCKATLRELQELAESTQRLSDGLRVRHPEVPWVAISGFRNILVHDYLGLNLDRVSEVIEHELRPLREAVLRMLAELDPPVPPA